MIKTKRWCGGTNEEYETQHYGFGSQRLQIAIRQMVEQKITVGIREMNTYLQSSLDLNDTDKDNLSRCCNKLIELYCERAGSSLDVIDKEIEKIMCIPAHTLLPADEAQIEQLNDDEYMELKKEVASLRQLVERKAMMEALLSAEEEELISAEKMCEMAKKDMDVIDILSRSLADQEVEELQSQTQILCDNVPFIKSETVLGILK